MKTNSKVFNNFGQSSALNAPPLSLRENMEENLSSPNIIAGAYNLNIEEVKRALDKDPMCINQLDHFDQNAVHIAAYAGNHSLIEYLLKQPNVDLNQKNKIGQDPLDVAMETGHQLIIKTIFRFRAQQIGLISQRPERKAKRSKLKSPAPL